MKRVLNGTLRLAKNIWWTLSSKKGLFRSKPFWEHQPFWNNSYSQECFLYLLHHFSTLRCGHKYGWHMAPKSFNAQGLAPMWQYMFLSMSLPVICVENYTVKKNHWLKARIKGWECSDSRQVMQDASDNRHHKAYVFLYIVHLTFQALFSQGHFTPSWGIHTTHR